MKKTVDSVNLKVKSDVTKSVKSLEQLIKTITRLKKVSANGAGLGKFGTDLDKFSSKINPAIQSLSRLNKGFGLLKLGVTLAIVRKIGHAIGGWVNQAKIAQENLNLFRVSLGSYSEEFLEYADEVQEKIGIYKGDFLRNIGIYKQILTGFGVVEDKAVAMSKTLSQLSYDIASFFNIKIETAMEKMQSALSGELRPLRRLGYSFDVATLKQVALNHGLDITFEKLTQAEKVQLRFLAVFEQSSDKMGDMARTIASPANMMRVLNEQFKELNEQLGNVFIPLLQRSVPYIQAFTRILTDLAERMAILMGFEITPIDLSNIENRENEGPSPIEGQLEGAIDKAKELKKVLLSFDEVNMLSDGNSGNGENPLDYFKDQFNALDMPGYDTFLEAIESKTGAIYERLKIKAKELIPVLENLVELIKGFGDGISKWWKDTGKPFFVWLFEKLKKWAKSDDMRAVGEKLFDIVELFIKIKIAIGLIAFVAKMATWAQAIGGVITALNGVLGKLALIAIPVAITLGVIWRIKFFMDNPEEMVKYVTKATDDLQKSWIGDKISDLLLWGKNLSDKMPSIIPDWGRAKKDYGLIGRADGGTVARGQMFVANESGPEVVGNLGGRTAVANQKMITDALKQAMIEGLAQAGGMNNQPTTLIVNYEGVEMKRMVLDVLSTQNMRTGGVTI